MLLLRRGLVAALVFSAVVATARAQGTTVAPPYAATSASTPTTPIDVPSPGALALLSLGGLIVFRRHRPTPVRFHALA